MSEKIFGGIKISKRIRQHSVWMKGPMSYAQAWIDLLLLANDKPRTVCINGEYFQLKRGQLAWSKRALERQWNRSGNWVDRFLEWCRDETMILVDSTRRRTIITILNYDAYQAPITGTKGPTESPTDMVTKGPQNGERGTGNGELGTGKVEPGTVNVESGTRNNEPRTTGKEVRDIPSDQEVAAFCAGYRSISIGIDKGIPEMWWRIWLSNALKMHRFPSDWKRCMENAYIGDFIARKPCALGAEFFQKKDSAPGADDESGTHYEPADFSKI